METFITLEAATTYFESNVAPIIVSKEGAEPVEANNLQEARDYFGFTAPAEPVAAVKKLTKEAVLKLIDDAIVNAADCWTEQQTSVFLASKAEELRNKIYEQLQTTPESAAKEIIFTGLGEASVCWSETTNGVFDSKRCEAIGEKLYNELFGAS